MLFLKLFKEKIKVKVTLFLIFVSLLSVNAQEKPDWIYGKPVGEKFIFYVGAGSGNSIQDAFESAFNNGLNSILKEEKVTINTKSITKKISNIVNEEGKIKKSSFNQDIINELNLEASGIIVGVRFVDFFYESKNNRCWVLLAKARLKTDLVHDCISYRKTPIIWRSCILPGWGQFYNNKKGRGLTILASEAIFITATVYSEMMRADNKRKSLETLDINIIKEYRKRADLWEARRNVALGGAIAVYAVNLLDATLGKGKIKYAYIPENIRLFAYKEGNINQFGLQINF